MLFQYVAVGTIAHNKEPDAKSFRYQRFESAEQSTMILDGIQATNRADQRRVEWYSQFLARCPAQVTSRTISLGVDSIGDNSEAIPPDPELPCIVVSQRTRDRQNA